MNKKKKIITKEQFDKIPNYVIELPYGRDDFKHNYVTADKKLQLNYRRSKMGWILNLIPFGKTLLFKGVMMAVIWVIRNVIRGKMTQDLLKYISVSKYENGDYKIGVETSKLQSAARKTSVKWDDRVADLAVVINEELYNIKNP